MADIFNRLTEKHGGSFSADGATITFPNVVGFQNQFAGDYGFLVQQLSGSYQQQVTRLYEVGTSAIYYVAGRTQGNLTIDRIIGPATIQKVFYQKFGDVCNAQTNTLDFAISTGCGNRNTPGNLRGQVAYTCYFCVITSIGFGIQAGDMLIRENLQIMFSGLDYNTGN